MSTIENLCPNCFVPEFTGQICSHCSYALSGEKKHSLVLPPGSCLKQRYILGRVLGVGGFGITYLALDVDRNLKCAIKEYFPNGNAVRDGFHVVASGSTVRGVFDHGISVFLHEAQILRQFDNDPTIVHVFDWFCEHKTAYLVMEYLDGVNLKRLANSSGGRLSFHNAKEVFFIIAEALKRVHEKGLLHRDISPENIFVTKQGSVKLIDFGATRYFIGEASRSLSVILKPGFAPPEQYSSKGDQGPWTDIYGLAATLYSVLSGDGIPDALERLNGKPLVQLNQIVPEAGEFFSVTLERALDLNYKKRFQSIDELLVSVKQDEKQPNPRNKLAEKPYIQFITGPLQGQKWHIPIGISITIGRTTSGNIIIQDSSISREHCTLSFSEDKQRFLLRDVSSNGTYCLSGERLAKGQTYSFPANSIFYLSTDKFTLKVGID